MICKTLWRSHFIFTLEQWHCTLLGTRPQQQQQQPSSKSFRKPHHQWPIPKPALTLRNKFRPTEMSDKRALLLYISGPQLPELPFIYHREPSSFKANALRQAKTTARSPAIINGKRVQKNWHRKAFDGVNSRKFCSLAAQFVFWPVIEVAGGKYESRYIFRSNLWKKRQAQSENMIKARIESKTSVYSHLHEVPGKWSY